VTSERAPLALVLARARNGVIGKDGGLPWHLPEDLKHFRRVTTGHAIIMGRKTYASIGRPLPQRHNVVVSRQPGLVIAGCYVASSLERAIAHARELGDEEPRVIGGAEIYALALPFATRIFLTEVNRDVDGDTTMPPFDPAVWIETSRVPAEASDVAFVTLERRD